MATYDASEAECLVFSFKDGLLSKLAHDLKMKVDRFSLKVDEGTRAIEATFDANSLDVICARVDGRDDPGTLCAGDKKKIRGNITKDVLRTKKFPDARFVSSEVTESGDGFVVQGTLTLHGQSRPLRTTVREEGGRWVADVRIHQPDFGIKPFTAALGALKVKPDVEVRISVPKR